MAAKRAPRWLIIGIACLFCTYIPAAPAATDPLPASKLDNATCQTCHDGGKSALSITDDKGKKRALHVKIAGCRLPWVHGSVSRLTLAIPVAQPSPFGWACQMIQAFPWQLHLALSLRWDHIEQKCMFECRPGCGSSSNLLSPFV